MVRIGSPSLLGVQASDRTEPDAGRTPAPRETRPLRTAGRFGPGGPLRRHLGARHPALETFKPSPVLGGWFEAPALHHIADRVVGHGAPLADRPAIDFLGAEPWQVLSRLRRSLLARLHLDLAAGSGRCGLGLLVLLRELFELFARQAGGVLEVLGRLIVLEGIAEVAEHQVALRL